MNKYGKLYRAALALLPQKRYPIGRAYGACADAEAVRDILIRNHARGAVVARFDVRGVTDVMTYGLAREGVPCRADTLFRVASVSKLVSAYGAMLLAANSGLALDKTLPFCDATPRELMTHTSIYRDGESYTRALTAGAPLSQLVVDASNRKRDHAFEYSNFAAGMLGCAIEAATGKAFERYMQETVFAPLGVQASYYPQNAGDALANAWRVLPPRKAPPFDAQARAAKPLPQDAPDIERHYLLAHGSLCISAPDLAKIGVELMRDSDITREMRQKRASFGARASNLSQGLGTFILEDSTICKSTLYGHQGLAYGAVHGLFFEPGHARGVVLLTSGASEQRRGVLAQINRELLTLVFGGIA